MSRVTNLNIFEGKLFLKDLIFILLSGNSYGGAINIDSSNCIVSVSDSLFINCSVTSYGGAIYCSNLFNFSLLRCCGFRCTSNYMGQFIYCTILGSVINYNQINFSSTLLCAYDYTFPYYSVFLNNGLSYSTNLNCSNNYVGKHLGGIGSSSGTSFKVLFSTFYKTKSCMAVGFGGYNSNQEFEFSNIIETQVYGDNHGLVHINSNGIKLKLKNFIFLNNNGYINDGTNGIIEYENCFFDNFNSIRGGYNLINCITTGITSTHKFIYLNTFYCEGHKKLLFSNSKINLFIIKNFLFNFLIY